MNTNIKPFGPILLLLMISLVGNVFAQSAKNLEDININSITTGVPFLTVGPDARASGMGDVGAATTPDGNATHWNLSKLAFMDKNVTGGASLSYVPWLRKIVNDINIAYLSGFYRINDKFTVASSLKYFNLGKIQFTDQVGNSLGEGNPNELAIDAGLAYRIGKNFSMGMAFRYIYSNLAAGYATSGATTEAGNAFAADVNGTVRVPDIRLGSLNSEFRFGFNISNIGSKISYSGGNEKSFLPANLRLGAAYEIELNDHNSITVAFDVNKLLAPTPPAYADPVDVTNNGTAADSIVSGIDPNSGILQGIFGSFSDAPGNVSYDPATNAYSVEKGSKFKEEMAEIQASLGLEYLYKMSTGHFAIRGGFFHESPRKGARQFVTLGAGFKFKVATFDLSYLASLTRDNPLANTIRVSVNFEFGKLAKSGEKSKS